MAAYMSGFLTTRRAIAALMLRRSVGDARFGHLPGGLDDPRIFRFGVDNRGGPRGSPLPQLFYDVCTHAAKAQRSQVAVRWDPPSGRRVATPRCCRAERTP
ncbi:MAG: hypothetical protein ACYS8L_08220 [Planctomycetota bacterium]|jgi:hypothetical protein